MKLDILIIHPGTQHSYEVALAIQEGKWDFRYITSFFYKDEKFPYRLVKELKFLDKKLRKRYYVGLKQDFVMNIPFYEFVEQGIRWFLGNKLLTQKLVYWRDRMFDRHVSRNIIGKRLYPKLVIGYPNASLYSFQKIKNLGGIAIIDMPIAYYKEGKEILSEEKKLHPEFADSITYSDFDNEYEERVNGEIDLADFILAPSKFVINTFKKYGFHNKKFILLPYGSYLTPIALESIKFSDKESPLRVLYVGQLSQRKGIKYLLEAVKELRMNNCNIELTMIGKIYGSGKWMSNYEGFFKYIPFLNRDKLREQYLEHDVFVFPSLFEGFGLVILEALSCGLPVITTPNTGAEAIEDCYNGFIIPLRDKEAIKEKLLSFYEEREKLNQMKINAVKSSYNFTWDKYRKNLIKVLNDVVKV